MRIFWFHMGMYEWALWNLSKCHLLLDSDEVLCYLDCLNQLFSNYKTRGIFLLAYVKIFYLFTNMYKGNSDLEIFDEETSILLTFILDGKFTYSEWYDFNISIVTITWSFIDGNFSKSSNVKFEWIDISLTFALLYSKGQIVIDGKSTLGFVSVWVLLPVSFFASFITLKINIIQKAIVKMHAKALLITVMIFYF